MTMPTKTTARRRGSVLAVLVVVLALMGLVVVGVVRPLRDEASIAALRVETTRAFYAAESGAIVVMQGSLGATPLPVSGDETAMLGQTVRFTQVPEAPGIAIVEGLSGDATRRVELMIE